MWESLTKIKQCVVRIKHKDDLCCVRVIVTMKERVDKGSHFNNLRNGRPIQEILVKQLHQEAGVPEGPCGFEELTQFQEFLGPQVYQLSRRTLEVFGCV